MRWEAHGQYITDENGRTIAIVLCTNGEDIVKQIVDEHNATVASEIQS